MLRHKKLGERTKPGHGERSVLTARRSQYAQIQLVINQGCVSVPASLAEVMGDRKLWSELVRTLYSLIKEVKTSP